MMPSSLVASHFLNKQFGNSPPSNLDSQSGAAVAESQVRASKNSAGKRSGYKVLQTPAEESYENAEHAAAFNASQSVSQAFA